MNQVEVNESGTSMTDVFELPLDNGVFVRNGVKTLLKAMKKNAPGICFEIDKKEKSIRLMFGRKMTTAEVFRMVDSVMDLLDTKMCPICGIGLVFGYYATRDRLCKQCRRDWDDYRFLMEAQPVVEDDIPNLTEYDLLEADLKRLEKIAVDIELALWHVNI